MNRIIVIGNGFDKAHGLATGYKDFIDAYWNEFGNEIYQKYSDRETALTYSDIIGTSRNIYHEDDFVKFEIFHNGVHVESIEYLVEKHKGAYGGVLKMLYDFYKKSSRYYNSLRITFKNNFWGHISNRCYLTNWFDIENEYYEQLKELLEERDAETRHRRVQYLNQDFEAVKKSLEEYLIQTIAKTNLSPIFSIQKAFESFIEPQDIAHRVREDFITYVGRKASLVNTYTDQEMNDFIDIFLNSFIKPLWQKHTQTTLYKGLQNDAFKAKYCRPENTLLLNFNYTNIAERLYANGDDEVIHIHGELNNPHNPIIFGYGDEWDEEYKRIEKLQDNDFLENIKSIRYHETGNYRNLLSCLEADLYQVVVMGHSCGNSDRTLLNTLFEHPNCASVKVYYHQIDENKDDYSQIVRNISRNFNDKAAMRDKVVNKELCTPLVPIQKE